MKGRNVRPITDLKNRTKDQLQDTLAMLKLLAQSQDSLAKGEKTYSTAKVRHRAQAALRRFQAQ